MVDRTIACQDVGAFAVPVRPFKPDRKTRLVAPASA